MDQAEGPKALGKGLQDAAVRIVSAVALVFYVGIYLPVSFFFFFFLSTRPP